MLISISRFLRRPICDSLFWVFVVSSFLFGLFVGIRSIDAFAQTGGIITSSGSGDRGATVFEGNVLHLRSKDRTTPAPTVYGILMPPEQEPILPSQHRATWTWCEFETSTLLSCEDKMNINGTILKRGAVKWSLPSS